MIKFIKLTNGDTLIGDMLGATDRTLTLLNPIEVVIKGVSAESKASMVGYQWLPFIEDENIIELNAFHIIAVSDAPLRVKEFYSGVVDQFLYPEKYDDRQDQKEVEKYKEILEEIKKVANTGVKTVH
jgi:hypothetical protein